MCDRCVMPSPGLPASSLSTANCLPAGRVLRWAASYLIYITLSSIRRAVFRPKSHFLPALRETRGRGSLEPRAIAVDVVGHAGEARAVAADDRDECLVEPPAVGVGGGKAIARRRHTVAQPGE